ncbi:oligosaccharide flippase family protein [Flaviaesturariibacter amylovorans]|uniref:Flippase n=1 Tax=Flaviaesturariibacter amylovorans TaxID=1084520 RepID=A0ABP8GRV6_9BACT
MDTPAGNKRKILTNILSLSLLQIGNFVLPMITLPLVSRIIGPGNYGVINYIFAYVYYFVLFINAGFDLYGVRQMVAAKGDQPAIDSIVSRILVAKTYILTVCTIVFTVLVFTVPQLSGEKLVSLFAYLYCLGWVINPSWVYHSKQETRKFAVFSFFSKLFFSVAIVLSIQERSDYIYHPLITSLAHVGVSWISLRYALRRYGIKVHWAKARAIGETFKDIRHISFIELIRNQAHLTNIIIAGTMLSIRDTGFYTAALRIVIIVQSIIAMPLNTVLFPYVGEAFTGSHENGMDRLRKTLPYVFAITFGMSVFVLLFAEPLIGFVFGREFAGAAGLLRIFAFGLLFSNLNTALGQHVMLNLRLDAVYIRIMVTGFAANIGLLFWLHHLYGLAGTAAAWPIAELCILLMKAAYLHHKGVRIIDLEYYKPRQFYLNALKLRPSKR